MRRVVIAAAGGRWTVWRPLAAAAVLIAASLAGGCAAPAEGTAHDDFRATCAAAAKAHLVAADQAGRGAMTPAAFIALDDAFDSLAARCRASLTPDTETSLLSA